MFVYWANEAKNPFFKANNFKLWVRSLAEAITVLYNIPEEGDKEQYNFLYNEVSKLMYKVLMKMWYKNGDVKKEDLNVRGILFQKTSILRSIRKTYTKL